MLLNPYYQNLQSVFIVVILLVEGAQDVNVNGIAEGISILYYDFFLLTWTSAS